MLDIDALMQGLARRRRLFHSEADFQHALAWVIHETSDEHDVRLEFPVTLEGKRLYVDICIPEQGIAIELKYCTRSLSTKQNGESFNLLTQGAQDVRRYDFLRDIQRLERICALHNGLNETYAVFLSNDPLFWRTDRPLSGTVDTSFRLHQGRTVEGTLAWSDQASPGTKNGRESAIDLQGKYLLQWEDYSNLDTARYGHFRYLAVRVCDQSL